MDKHLIRIEINNLLDAHCHGCKLMDGVHQDRRLAVCKTCPYYKQIRQLGDQLLTRSEPRMKMSVEEYKDFKSKKMNIEEIAKAKQVSPATVYNWKKAHKDEIKSAEIEPKSAKNDTKIAENVQKVNDSANQLVASKLTNRVKEQQKVITKLQEESAGRLRQIDALVEDKRKWLEERDKLKSGIEGTDETVARTERYAKKIAELEKERAELFRRNQNQAGTIEVLKKNLDAAIATTTAKDNLIAEMNATTADRDDGIDRLKNEKSDLLKSTQNQASTINTLQKNLDSANTLYQEKCKQINDLNAAADDLESEIAELKKYKNDADQGFAYAQKELDKLQNENAELSIQLTAAMNFIHILTAK